MEEQVIKSLLEFYKDQGMDLYAVLDDPIFEKLPLSEKVRALKTHASEIAAGTDQGMSKQEIRNILTEAALAGGAAGLISSSAATAVASNFATGKVPYKAVLIGGAAGAGIGALTNVLSARGLIGKRKTILEKLRELEKTPTDNNAIKLLALRNQQINPNTSVAPKPGHMVQMLIDKIKEIPGHLAFTLIPDIVRMQTANNHHDQMATIKGVNGAPDRTILGGAYAEEIGKELQAKGDRFSSFVPK